MKPIQQMLKPKLSLQQLQFICRQLAFALAGGMPLPDALLLVGTEMHPARCRRFLLQVGEAVEQGQTMTQALQQSRFRYSPVLLEFVVAGEQNGTMQIAMTQAADYFSRQNQTRQMLSSALFYPVVLLVLMVVAFGAMFLFVVPTVVQTYENFEAELPVMTRRLLSASGWLQTHWPILLGIVIGMLLCWFCFRKFADTASVWREREKKLLLHVPIVGNLYRQYWFIQISQALGLMLSSGMLLSHSVQAVQQVYRRGLFTVELAQLQQALAEGHSFAAGIQHCSFVPKMARQMLIVSEQTGALSTALTQLSQYYQQLFQQRLQRIIGMLEPGFVLLLGIGILLMAGSLFLPLVQSYQYLL